MVYSTNFNEKETKTKDPSRNSLSLLCLFLGDFLQLPGVYTCEIAVSSGPAISFGDVGPCHSLLSKKKKKRSCRQHEPHSELWGLHWICYALKLAFSTQYILKDRCYSPSTFSHLVFGYVVCMLLYPPKTVWMLCISFSILSCFL